MLRLLAVRHIAHHLLDSQALRKRQRIELLRGDALKRPGLHIAGRIRFFGIVSRHIGSLASAFSTPNSVSKPLASVRLLHIVLHTEHS